MFLIEHTLRHHSLKGLRFAPIPTGKSGRTPALRKLCASVTRNQERSVNMKFCVLIFILLTTMGCSESSQSNDASSDQFLIDMSRSPDMSTDAADANLESDTSMPDAMITGTRPSIMPLEGDPTLPGATILTNAVSAGTSRAGRVVEDAERLQGPEANCRVGDFRLDNAKISVCIQAETTFSQFSFFGGNIVDAHLADRPGTDSFREVFVAPGLGEARVDSIGIVRDGSEGGHAVIRTEGFAQGALILQGVLPNAFLPPASYITTEYRLEPDSNAVEILTWIHIRESFSVNLRLVDFVYFGDRTTLFNPDNILGEFPNKMPYVAATANDVSYAWETDFAPFSFYVVSALGLPGAPITSDSETLNADDIRLYQRRLVVGGGDVESLKNTDDDAIEVQFQGQANTHIVIITQDAKAVTTILLNEEGRGAAQLKADTYRVRNWPLHETAYEESFTVSPDSTEITLTQPIPGTLSISIRDVADQPIDGMVRLTGPRNQIHFVLGDHTLDLSEGEWTASVSRGWHYSLQTETFTIESGQTLNKSYTLTEEIPLSGFASGEFHQHASPSLDSELAVEERVKSNLAAGVDFMVPSDHDIIYPYQQLIDNMGVSDRIGAPLTGEEISPLVTHIGAYGIPYDPYAGAGGALRIPVTTTEGRWRVLDVPELIDAARDKGAQIIQINHPRASQGYFDHVNYSPQVPIESLDPMIFSTDFDTLEIFNSPNYFCKNFQDWQGLLNQGLRVTAIGNSDTHSRNDVPGYPRNYLKTLAPNPVNVTAAEITDSVRKGAVTMGGGAMMDFPTGTQPGDTISVNDGAITLHVRVQTPSFTKVDRLMVIANGLLILDQPINSSTEDIVDFDENLTLNITEDAHVTVMALGNRQLEVVRPGGPVFAMSNPVWVDVENDGLTLPGAREVPSLNLFFCSQ
jgi:hypothetical protein